MTDQWRNGEELLAGKPALVRKNVSLDSIPRLEFPYELIVHLVYEECKPNGLPSSQEEIDLLDHNEHLVSHHFCSKHNAKFALCVTSDGVRDLFLYLPNLMTDNELDSVFEALPVSVDFDYGMRKVSDWDIYDYALSERGPTSPRTSVPWWKKLLGLGGNP